MNDNYEHWLIEACINGDRKAQKRLYEQLAPKMFALCIRYAGDRDTASDMLQDGFVTLFSKMDSFQNKGSFEGWARKLFVNTCLMHLRKNDVLKDSDDLAEVRHLPAGESGQIEQIGYKELMELVMQLPPGFRTVFNMFAIEGYSHKEIAEELGITESTSRTQLNRARTWLQKRIKELTDV